MNKSGGGFSHLTINTSKFFYAINLTSALVLLTVGGSLRISQEGTFDEPRIADIVRGNMGMFIMLVALIDIFVNTVYVVTVSKNFLGCIHFEVFIMACSIAMKIIAINNPEKIAPLFVKKSVFIRDFSLEDIKFDVNNSILLPRDSLAQSWAIVQMKLLCCGLSGPNDYSFMKSYQRQGVRPMDHPFKAPLSCCIFDQFIPGIGVERDLLEECRTNERRVHQRGCFVYIWKTSGIVFEVTRVLVIVLIPAELGQLIAFWRTLRWHHYELENYLP